MDKHTEGLLGEAIKLSPRERAELADALLASIPLNFEIESAAAIPLAANGSATRESLPPDEWIEEFHKWSRRPRTRNPRMDDSRESIYEGRGE